MIEAIVMALVPSLIHEAEALLGQPKPEDNSWIVGLVKEIASLLEDHLPGWLKPAEEELERLVEEAIEKLVEKI